MDALLTNALWLCIYIIDKLILSFESFLVILIKDKIVIKKKIRNRVFLVLIQNLLSIYYSKKYMHLVNIKNDQNLPQSLGYFCLGMGNLGIFA